MRQRIGPSIPCQCCGAQWQDKGCVRGYTCDCDFDHACKHCGKCKRHCTGDIDYKEIYAKQCEHVEKVITELVRERDAALAQVSAGLAALSALQNERLWRG